jgi:hypothetical protein
MGSTCTASCKCGFEKEVTIGGSMEGFGKVSYFPHYCENCGLVQVNIAKGRRGKRACPTCKNPKLHEYGSDTVSTPIEGDWVALTWGEYQANEHGNLCPACKKMTLVFDRFSGIRFD